MSGAFDMGEAVRPSALIRTARWSLLVVGIWYGARRYVFKGLHYSIAECL